MSSLAGSFSSNGVSINGTKSTANRISVGHYQVSFPSGSFTSSPAIAVSPQSDNIAEGYVVSVTLQEVSSSGFTLFCQDLGTPPQNKDVGFSFIAQSNS